MQEENVKEIKEFLGKEVEAKSQEINNSIEEKLSKLSEAGETKAAELKAEIQTDIDKFNELHEKAAGEIDRLDAELKKAQDFASPEKKDQALGEILIKQMTESEVYKKYAEDPKSVSGFSIPMVERKDMTFGGSVTGEPSIDQKPGIVPQVSRKTRVRQLIPVGATDSNTTKFLQETAVDNATAGMATEGVAKQKSDYTLVNQDAPVRKIADHTRISDEMLADIAGMASFLSIRGVERVMDKEDEQLLRGDGTGVNLTGVSVNGLAFARVVSASALTNTQQWDAIVNAAAQIGGLNYMATGALVHPHDFGGMLLAKDTTADYVAPFVWNASGQPFIYDIPIFISTAQVAGTFTVGDWRMGAMILQREGVSARFFDQNEDDAVKNLVTVVLEERLAFQIYYPDSFITETFANAKTTLET